MNKTVLRAQRAATVVAVVLGVCSAAVGLATPAGADPLVPGPVGTPLSQTVTATSIAVSWTPPDDLSRVTGYQVDYSSDNGASWQQGAVVADPAASNATVTGLTPGTPYDLQVEALGVDGPGPTRLVDAVTSMGLDDTDPCVVLANHAVRCWGAVDGTDTITPFDVTALASSDQVTSTGGQVCALRTNNSVSCGDIQSRGAATTFTDIAGLPHDITQIGRVTQAYGCVLTANGAVWCWGNNRHGALGIGDRSVDSSATAVRVTGLGPVSELATGGNMSGEYMACAVLRQGGQLECWGSDDFAQLGDGNTGPDQFAPVPVPGLTNVSSVSVGYIDACAVADPNGTGDNAVYCWGLSSWGGDPTAPELVGNTAGATSVAAQHDLSMTPCTTGSSGGACDEMQSSDITTVGTDGFELGCALYEDGSLDCQAPAYSDWYWGSVHRVESSAITTADASVPSAPNDLQLGAVSGEQVGLSWLAPLSGGSPLTGYVLQRSTDGGDTWATADTTGADRLTVTEPAYGRADLYRVLARNAVGRSDPSSPVIASQGGTQEQQISIRTASGQPVSGGAVTWESDDGTAGSAVPSALTAAGVLTFPRVVAGAATVTIAGGVLPNGTTVSGSWPVTLGTDPQTLSVPALPDIVTRTVTVTLPNGVPVIGASVRGTAGFATNPCTTVSGFTLCGGVNRTAQTDANGQATISSWATNQSPLADVVYSDGVLAQRQSVAVPTADTDVQLQYMPWLTLNSDGSPVDVGALSTLAFTVNDAPGADGVTSDSTAAGSPARVQVVIKPPAGWAARRCSGRSHLTGTTDSHGRLTLRLCASRSGVYQVTARGAVTARSVFLRVRGAAPTAPTSLTARSPRAGTLTASWGRPVYAGGAVITGYRLTATAPHQRTRTALVTGSTWSAQSMTHHFTHLTAGRVWTVRTQAITRYGASTPTTATVTVA